MRVDFYILENGERLLFACRLLEKVYLTGHKVYVCCDDQKTAETLDELLWTFKEESFIPHNLQGEGPTPPPAIQIGYKEPPSSFFRDLLLNLSTTVPTFFTQFNRVLEIVGENETEKAISRQHFAYYKSQQILIETHKVS